MTRATTLRIGVLAVLTAALPLLTGCLERSERLTVRPNGQTVSNLTIKADKANELTPGRVPSEKSGWEIKVTDPGNGQKVILTATQTFDAGKPLPSNDAAPDDPLIKAYVQFPTTVKVEKRSDGVYYHFRRVYAAHPWAWLAYEDERPGSKEIKEILSTPKDKVTREQLLKAVNFSIESMVLKKLDVSRAAALEIKPDLAQEKWLSVVNAARDASQKIDRESLVDKLKNPGANGKNDTEIVQQITAAETQLDNAIRQTLESAGLTPSQLTRYAGLVNFYNARHSAISNARIDGFEVIVELPGTLIGTNGQATADGHARWQFTGEAFSDRSFELLATSKAPSR